MTAEEFTARRKKLFPTQTLAARALGVTQGAICHWETGRRAISGTVRLLLESLEKDPKAVRAIINMGKRKGKNKRRLNP